jgi:hypothetical protein
MRMRLKWMLAAWACCATPALAQSGANVTLQLPNFSIFGVQTTVVVPDSGPAPLARDRMVRAGRNQFGGLPPQRAIGRERRDAIASVTAKIHDADAADRAVRQQARADRPPAAASAAQLPSVPAVGQLQSVAEIKRRRALEAAQNRQQALAHLDKAREARRDGKPAIAAIYYTMAAKHAAPDLKRQIEAEARTVSQKPPRVANQPSPLRPEGG